MANNLKFLSQNQTFSSQIAFFYMVERLQIIVYIECIDKG